MALPQVLLRLNVENNYEKRCLIASIKVPLSESKQFLSEAETISFSTSFTNIKYCLYIKMSLKQMNTRFIAKTTFPSPNRAAKQIMYTIPVVLEKFYGRFLHHKRHVGLSRKARCQKPRHHTFDVLSKMNNPKEMKNPMNSIFSQVSFTNAKKSYPCGFPSAQIRFASSSSDNFVTNEAEFDTILHERDFEIHRHHRSPVSGIVKYGRNALTKVDNPKVLDIGSSPIDPSLSLVRDLPGASLCAINSSRDMLKIISDQLAEDEFQNISTELNDLANLSEFEDGWFDLVISCYGLHVSMNKE